MYPSGQAIWLSSFSLPVAFILLYCQISEIGQIGNRLDFITISY